MTSLDENGIMYHPGTLSNWVKDNLRARQCNRFTCPESDSPSEDDPKCQCGKKKSDHDKSHLDKPRPESKWQFETHTEEIPVDAFGKMEFCLKKPYPTKRYESIKQQDLDPGHSHFLMFDDGTTNTVAIENLVWGKIVQKICEKQLHREETGSQKGVTIPSVCLTANGTTTSLATVYENIIHGTPCLVIENTGTMADILTYAVKHARPVQVDKDKNQTYFNINKSKPVRYLNNEALSHISRQIQKHFGIQDLAVSLDRIKVCVRDPRLIATYRMDDVSESAEGLLHAIVNYVLSNCFQYAIRQKAIDFVDLFIDNGAVLHKAELEELYNELWLCTVFTPAIAAFKVFDEEPVSQKKHSECVPGDEENGHKTRDREPSWWEKLEIFYSTPAIKFQSNVIMQLIFLLLFSYTILTNFRQDVISWQEYVLIGWVATIILEELRQRSWAKTYHDKQNAAICGIIHRHDDSNDFEGYHRVHSNSLKPPMKGISMISSINQKSYARNYLMKGEMKVSDTVEVEIDGVFKKFNFRRSCVESKLNQMDDRVKILTSVVKTLEAKEFGDDDDEDDYVENEIHDKVHYHSRSSPYPGTTKRRFPVLGKKVNWKVPFVGYQPVAFTHDSLLNGPAEEVDPELLQIEKEKLPKIKFNGSDEQYKCNRKSLFGDYELDEEGLPRWKKGSTGDVEQKNEKKVLQFLAIKKTRKDTTWSLPTMRVKDVSVLLVGDDLSEKVTEDLLFELDFTNNEKETIRKEVDKFLCNHQYTEIYKGYVDDARNTDNAWVEVEARSYHDADKFLFGEWDSQLEERLFKVPRLKWMDVESSTNMRYTSHKDLLRLTAKKLDAYF
ncbi:ADP-ribose pyrophosphatase, mitochondrial [Holothuria leucospilota]|uniref:ADP-ribose pyrophosphatase, mitochondrial n=1 Tax=Holothuria leucospilota TaxID=206669 RepID=A0A9Q1BYZ9_HOLLE|nr:ADP-ribose pyrophosphatase, mitochondrial [Holothuria leucospilota]